MGSSPRMRGTLMVTVLKIMERGIIPAYAGNTGDVRSVFIPLWDHPRVCGEHQASSQSASNTRGSSPRMRGTPSSSSCVSHLAGIIPAYAGNTSIPFDSFRLSGDHPRVCGEHRKRVTSTKQYPGSSPRMRGTHLRYGNGVIVYGIIPAYAGNTGY